MNTRLTQKLSSFGLKHYQIIACFFRQYILCDGWFSWRRAEWGAEKMFSIFFTGWCRLQPAYNAIHFSFIFNMFFHILLLPCSWYYYFFMGEFLLYFFWNYTYVCGCNVEKIAHTNTCEATHEDTHIFFGYSERERKKKIVVDNFFGPSFSRSCTHLPILFWHILNTRYTTLYQM